jgi:hypothetical protein
MAPQSSHIEESVNQERETPRLSRGNADSSAYRFALQPVAFEGLPDQLNLKKQGSERRSQLVCRDGQEVVPRPDSLQSLGEEASILQGDGGPVG